MNNRSADVGFEILRAVILKSSIFWDIMPCIPLKINRRFGETCRLHLQGRRKASGKQSQAGLWLCLPPAFKLISCLANSSTLKTEATCFSGPSVDFQRTTWHCIPEDGAQQMCWRLWMLRPVKWFTGSSTESKLLLLKYKSTHQSINQLNIKVVGRNTQRLKHAVDIC
jgi:hypothetical protein